MKRKDLTALTLVALLTPPTFAVASQPTAAPTNGIPSTLETTDFAAANAGFQIAADPPTAPESFKRSTDAATEDVAQMSSAQNFRSRPPVRENVGLPILDGARDRRDEPSPSPQPKQEPSTDELSRGLGGRVADQIAERIERAVDERVEALRAKFEAERRRWTLKLFFAGLGTVVAGTLLARSLNGLTTALVRALATLANRAAKRLAAWTLDRAKKLVESQTPPQNGPQS
ncbi:MAG: hypothetical protein IJE77_06590 [Thermoguttaceae bacterium]|nr:hypothetical protein [Thermoguttaceae bacterium]MBQ9800660.1 hypothetical protein [Thermoguttaceae bacterium]